MATERATIFVVDDDTGLLRLVQKSLQREGFSTAGAASGSEAIEWLSKNRADLMLLDLKLQDMEGQQLVNHLATIQRSVPFIIITGQGDERVAVEMMKRGALDYLVKDVRFIEFIPTVVRHALEKLEIDKRLAAAQAALEESKTQLLMVSEREQRRFGAELHDGLGQQLTGIELRCQALLQSLPAGRADLKEQLAQMGQYLREAISQTRSLARGLSPVKLGSGGLSEALAELAARMSTPGRIKCTFDGNSPVVVENDLAAGHLFRIAQEAVSNAVKHSGASLVTIRLTRSDDKVCLEIADNGKGLPTKISNQGLGMEFMRHRSSVIHADLDIKSRTGKGVTVTCLLPAEARKK
jgi:signal transduction histidine kinase